jgi:hypothetical protein
MRVVCTKTARKCKEFERDSDFELVENILLGVLKSLMSVACTE